MTRWGFVPHRGEAQSRAPRVAGRQRRGIWRRVAVGVLAAAVLVWAFVTFYLDELLRSRIERNVNRQLKGYTVTLPALDFHVLGFAVTLRGLELSQQAHPDPPVAVIERLDASVHWHALLHGEVVADFVFERPRLHINLPQLRNEARDPEKLHERGWQDAAKEIYPLEINRLEIRDGEITYLDVDPRRPLSLRNLDLAAENIRNVRAPEEKYPSTISIDAKVFERGQLRIDGRADFLAKPFAAVNADIEIAEVPLDAVKPAATHANLDLRNGILSARGHVEYGPERRVIDLHNATIRSLEADYFHTAKTAAAEAQRVETVRRTAKKISNEPQTLVRIQRLDITGSTLGYVERAREPGYRVFLASTDMTLRNLSNQDTEEPAAVRIEGMFMGSGKTLVTSTFRPVNKTPELDLNLQIESTSLPALNDVFRTYGGFDVTGGEFAFYSELSARDGEMRGYVKPLLTDMQVYSSRQDKEKSLLKQLYEGLLSGVAELLENSADDVATKAEVVGRVDDPNVRTWQMVLQLLRNAFIQAIRPGLDAAVDDDED